MDEHASTFSLRLTPDLKPRLEWVDYAKGLGIFLVVFEHVWNGLFHSNIRIGSFYPPLLIDRATFDFVDALVYSFHMPLFFFLSGMFVERSVKKGARDFLRDKMAAILWPYVIWTLIQGGINLCHPLYHGDEDLSASGLLLGLFYQPYAQFWFLYVLFIHMLIFLTLYRLRFGLWGIFVVAILFYLAHPLEGFAGTELKQVLQFFIYFAGGALARGLLVRQVQGIHSLVLTGAALVGGALLVGGNYLLIESPWSSQLIQMFLFPVACSGIFGTLAFGALLVRIPGFHFVRHCGKVSLQIYAVHILATTMARIVLVRYFHIYDVRMHLLMGVLAGVAVPVALDYLARRVRMSWLFSLHLERPPVLAAT